MVPGLPPPVLWVQKAGLTPLIADGVKFSDVSALIAEVEGAALASGEAADHARR
jgi:hypothetical protein